jgi:hypothetical protein
MRKPLAVLLILQQLAGETPGVLLLWEAGGRPGWPRRTFQVHNSRNPLRCQSITVSGFTMTEAGR